MQEGLKLELVQEPNRLPLVRAGGLHRPEVRLIDEFEIGLGKWQALSKWLAGRRYTGGDYVRHPADLAAMRTALRAAYRFRPKPLVDLVSERRGPGVTQALRELQDPAWKAHYANYLRRMGQLPVLDGRSFTYPPWPAVQKRVAHLALELQLVPERDRPEAWGLAGMEPPREELGGGERGR